MTDWIIRLIDQGGYWGVAVLMFLENIIPPIPSELIMGVAGIRAGQGRMQMMPLLLAGTVGTTIGNYVWFLAGRILGIHRLRPLVDRFGRWATVEWRDVERLNLMFHKYGPAIVFLFRFMPAFRTMVSLPAGLCRMGHVKFLIWTFGGSALWNIGLALAGYWLGYRFREIDRYIGPATAATIALIVLFYGWRLVTWKPGAARR